MDPEFFLKYCDEPCNEMLKCGDPCMGTCGQCWQGRLHKSCQNKCGNTLICGHRFVNNIVSIAKGGTHCVRDLHLIIVPSFGLVLIVHSPENKTENRFFSTVHYFFLFHFSCQFPCRRVCPPCNEPCNFRCKHSKCPKKCGVPCVECQVITFSFVGRSSKNDSHIHVKR